MRTKAFKMKLHPGQAAEYKKRHDELWPQLRDALLKAGAVDYRIFLDEETNILFAVLHCTDENTLDELPETEINQRWWAFMQDIMETNPDHSPIAVDLLPVFVLENTERRD